MRHFLYGKMQRSHKRKLVDCQAQRRIRRNHRRQKSPLVRRGIDGGLRLSVPNGNHSRRHCGGKHGNPPSHFGGVGARQCAGQPHACATNVLKRLQPAKRLAILRRTPSFCRRLVFRGGCSHRYGRGLYPPRLKIQHVDQHQRNPRQRH